MGFMREKLVTNSQDTFDGVTIQRHSSDTQSIILRDPPTMIVSTTTIRNLITNWKMIRVNKWIAA